MSRKPLTPEERAERAEAQKAFARQARAEYDEARQRVEENSARLRALRLAREAEESAGKKPAAATRKKSASQRTRKS